MERNILEFVINNLTNQFNTMRISGIIFVLYLLPNLLFAKDPYPIVENLDILHYKFEIQLNDQNNEINCIANVRFRLSENQNVLVLDLVKLQDTVGMTVDKVLLGEVPVLFSHQNNKFGNKTFFGDNWPDRARHWIPCVDHLSDKATVEFLVKAPSHYQVVANGFKKAQYPSDHGFTYTHYESSVPIPSKVMVIAVADFAIQTVGFAGQTPIETWVYPENMENGFLDYSPALEIVNYFNSRIGPYAFEKLANVQSKTVYGGMENSGAIFYYENSVTGKSKLHRLLAHEIAHQWFGDAVSEADWHHIWLSEGFATYMESVCMSELYSNSDLQSRMSASRSRVVNYYYRNPKPVIDTSIINLRRLLSTNSYQKGAWFLHMLRNHIGDEAFWKGLKSYYLKFKNKNALTIDFRPDNIIPDPNVILLYEVAKRN